MKAASAALTALLASRQFSLVDLFTFTLVGGTVLRYAAGTQDIFADKDVVTEIDVTLVTDFVNYGFDYAAGGFVGPFFGRKGKKALCKWRAGLQVDTLDFDVIPGTATVSGTPFKLAVINGAFDGATFTLERAVMPTYGDTSPGTVLMFSGLVGKITAGRGEGLHFQVNSHLYLLNQQLPRNLYQSGCIWTLYDAGCGLDPAAFSQAGSCAAGSTQMILRASLAQASGYFDLGKITITSGANAGQVRGIRSYVQGSPGTLTLLSPLPSAPATSDTFTAVAGCDKAQGTCSGKFNNLPNFRGFPYVPTPETAI